MIPMTTRKTPETVGPMIPVIRCSSQPSSCTCALTAATPKPRITAIRKMIVECPREKKKPTAMGRLPSAASLRVALSIAAMWSASKRNSRQAPECQRSPTVVRPQQLSGRQHCPIPGLALLACAV